MHKFPEQLDHRTFFRFNKDIILDGTWAGLPHSSKAIFPAIGVHCDRRTGEGWPNEETLAILAGVTPKTVRDGIKGLEAIPGFSKRQTTTARGHRKNIYTISVPKLDSERYFFFYKNVLDSGMWYHLNPTAKSLYPVMRAFGFMDYETLEEYGDDKDVAWFDGVDFKHEFKEFYSNRRYDFCSASLPVLLEKAGVSRRSLTSAWKSLIENHLVAFPENNARHIWKVFLKPPMMKQRDYINKKVEKRYGKERHEAIQ